MNFAHLPLLPIDLFINLFISHPHMAGYRGIYWARNNLWPSANKQWNQLVSCVSKSRGPERRGEGALRLVLSCEWDTRVAKSLTFSPESGRQLMHLPHLSALCFGPFSLSFCSIVNCTRHCVRRGEWTFIYLHICLGHRVYSSETYTHKERDKVTVQIPRPAEVKLPKLARGSLLSFKEEERVRDFGKS